MDMEAVQELIRGGETLQVEFKKGSINDAEMVEAVVCLANGSGGHLILGVEDDGEITGIPTRSGGAIDPARVEALIRNSTDPAVSTTAAVVAVADCDLLVVHVAPAGRVVATRSGKYLRRTIDVHGKPECLPMTPAEVVSRASSIGALDYSTIPLPNLELEGLSRAELDRFRNLAQTGGDAPLAGLADEDLLSALTMRTETGALTVGSVLLFGTEETIRREVPTYEAAFQELDGLEVLVNESSYRPLLRTMAELVERIEARNPEEEVEVGLFRVPLPRYAPTVIRELIANALVHRDYTALGPTRVEINRGTLSISNPGGFPEGVTAQNLLTTIPRPRNPALADAFKRAGLVERIGRGVNRAFEGQLSLGRPPPDYTQSDPTSVVARVRSGPADKELAGYIASCRQEGQEVSLNDLLVLHEVRNEQQITTERAAELFHVSSGEALSVLNDLVARGLVEARGGGRSRRYHLAAALYRQLGEPAEYVRTRGFDDTQHEQMILTYVESHGSITRSQASELCQVSPARASTVLRRLKDRGALQLVGQKRGSHYIKSP